MAAKKNKHSEACGCAFSIKHVNGFIQARVCDRIFVTWDACSIDVCVFFRRSSFVRYLRCSLSQARDRGLLAALPLRDFNFECASQQPNQPITDPSFTVKHCYTRQTTSVSSTDSKPNKPNLKSHTHKNTQTMPQAQPELKKVPTPSLHLPTHPPYQVPIKRR
jgi:hypothetical protein